MVAGALHLNISRQNGIAQSVVSAVEKEFRSFRTAVDGRATLDLDVHASRCERALDRVVTPQEQRAVVGVKPLDSTNQVRAVQIDLARIFCDDTVHGFHGGGDYSGKHHADFGSKLEDTVF